MAANPLQPPDTHRQMAMSVLQNAGYVRDFLDKCEACGLPVDQRRQELSAQCEFCTSYLRQFFPDALQ